MKRGWAGDAVSVFCTEVVIRVPDAIWSPDTKSARPPTNGRQILVEFRGVSKQLGGTRAADNIDLVLKGGEIHVLLGANGAGKTTLIKLLANVYAPDAGHITVEGQSSTAASVQTKITFIHQELPLYGWMTVGENVALTAGYAKRGPLISWRAVHTEADTILRSLGSTIPSTTLLSKLAQSDKSIVAIARALAVKASVVGLDEPTASLPEADVARLFDVLRRLRNQGVAILYVTHRLDEVFRIADVVTVLRDGKVASTQAVADTDPAQLVHDIVGRDFEDVFTRSDQSVSDEVILRLEEVSTQTLGPISLELHGGEILGLCGLRGAGHDLVGRAMSGVEPITSGWVVVRGKRLRPKDTSDAIANGVVFLSSKRAEEELMTSRTVGENIFVNPGLFGRSMGQFGRRHSESRDAQGALLRYGVTPPDPKREITTLSGGNQQKVVLARHLDTGHVVAVLEEPTQGVDVGAKADIYAIVRKALTPERGMIIVSSDFEEVAKICDRAIAFSRERIVGTLSGDDLNVKRLTHLVGGDLP